MINIYHCPACGGLSKLEKKNEEENLSGKHCNLIQYDRRKKIVAFGETKNKGTLGINEKLHDAAEATLDSPIDSTRHVGERIGE